MVKSEAEQQTLAAKVSHRAWIGLHRDPNYKFIWLWVDGSRATYFNWQSGEPNNQNEGCVEMEPTSSSSAGKWNDLDCERELHYVCKITGKLKTICYS